MDTDLVLRPAVADDIDNVLAFWQSSAEGGDRGHDRTAVERLLSHDPGALLLAVDGEEIVGSVIAGWDGWRCRLYRVAVRADRRQRGVARMLVTAAEDRCAALGGRRLDAIVLDGNRPGRAAWAALGYTPQPAWRRWVKRLDEEQVG